MCRIVNQITGEVKRQKENIVVSQEVVTTINIYLPGTVRVVGRSWDYTNLVIWDSVSGM